MRSSALFGLTLAAVASAQVSVQVGSVASAPGGIFQFIPNNITAANGTTVSFQFTGIPGNHSVTQSSFADPCNPVSGGFDSEWIFLPAGLTAPASPPTFNLTITDDTKPIWFFCKQLLPSPHCAAGMVGSINAPATGNTFDAFLTKAKQFTGPSGQGQGGLVGIGASASAGVGPVPSGATLFPAAATGTSPGAGNGTGTTGTAAAGSSTTASSGSVATESSFFLAIAAVLGGLLFA